ncbi:MAG: glycosyltransferase, partial [Caldilineae bacterium]
MVQGLVAWILLTAYTVSAVGLALYGLHALWLVLHLGPSSPARRPALPPRPPADDSLPPVTVQLPVYNEQHVVLRLLDACARLDYPRDRLQIQVLDDSTDQTTALVQARAAYWRERGVDVTVLHRADRTGFKAGALAEALPQAKGELVAIFDADFQPPAHFLRRIAPLFIEPGAERLGFVQARWGHLNADYSALTRCQALALDGHFAVEQAARQQAGYPFGFNGSAGVWRRACIEDPAVGGWQADTLCEDLDLSYRAQLAGWRPRYLDDLEAPAEIPPQLLAFKRQQFRWAKGSIQTLRKLAGPVWRSPWSFTARLMGTIHLGSYLVHPFLLLLLLITAPLLLLNLNPFWPLAYLSLASVGPPLLYAVAQRRLHGRGWWKRWAYLPLLTLFGTGLCLSNTLAVWQALRNRPSPFLRTPKFRVEQPKDAWQRSSYVLGLQPLILGEAALMLYASAG